MSLYEILVNVITFFQNITEDLCTATLWLWTPWEGLTAITGQEIAPIMLFGTTAVLAIIVFHVAHLVNIIAG